MKKRRPHVFIVDDEDRIRSSLASILDTYGYDTSSFSSAGAVFEALQNERPDCILLDVRMPGIDGMQAQRLLAERDGAPPVIIMTGHGDIAMAVTAMKNGAHDFIEKPVDDELLAASIEQALADDLKRSGVSGRVMTLSPRERVIASLVAKGYSSHAIAAELGISNRTVDHHRASILAKMGATSLPQLISMLMEAELHKK
jgi:two-component system response regulator FixJ